ncbi:putative S-adenosyl-L-methionine-dependent methyltransferase [Rosa chinensis]|uniref:Putative S-adenosyl-L-methionine-dependent methyltransferase n=1 Tax=Rosa chinensis TaxID=74649 RepID=A0A2P6S167_ROSCH|nr:uncharacterized protein At4g26485-like [Rosa chinensis]PRQ52419.1 putative S-adenosyl-L-methionine-dependent methyltransferase [Rosa chinensis]
MERWIEHYSSSQQILLVGEGDFSFSACLARAFGCAPNMVATSLDSQESLWEKHWSCVSHLDELRGRGCLVLHDVNVHDMDLHYILKWKKFDVIIFNFPHAGHYPWLRERDNQLIQMHRQLLSGFFASARVVLRSGGQIHVTTRDDYPYNIWNVEELAAQAGLVLREKVWFEKSDYPGYHNKRGGGIDSNKKFPLGESYTFKFVAKTYYMY